MNRLLLLIALCVGLIGCDHNPPKPDVRIVYRNTLVVPPDDLLKDCELQAPPNIEEYKAAEWTKKEELLVNAYRKAMEKTILCNIKNQGLRTWKQEQTRIFEIETSKPDK